MGSLRLHPSRREVPPPEPASRQFHRIARALDALGDPAAVARQLRVARAHVNYVMALTSSAPVVGATTEPAPALATVVPAPARPEWELLSEALARLIPRQADEAERYRLRLMLLRARYTPWRIA